MQLQARARAMTVATVHVVLCSDGGGIVTMRRLTSDYRASASYKPTLPPQVKHHQDDIPVNMRLLGHCLSQGVHSTSSINVITIA